MSSCYLRPGFGPVYGNLKSASSIVNLYTVSCYRITVVYTIYRAEKVVYTTYRAGNYRTKSCVHYLQGNDKVVYTTYMSKMYKNDDSVPCSQIDMYKKRR